MKKTKIVCTIGPATADVEVLKKMILAGMNVARLNFSHGGYQDQERFIKAVKQAREEVNMPVALLLDTQGPEIRTGKLAEAPALLKAEEEFTLVNEDIIGDNTKVSVTYKDLYKDVKPGTTILIDDGKIEIEVDRIEGKNVVIIGRSNIVGKPLMQCLLKKNATVTICHSKTKNISEITKKADILVAALGKAKFVTKEMVKEGAVVIDVGINRDESGKLVGDVDFEEVEKIASFITPVPGGVGPMTIAMLMSNVVKACKEQN